jgi:hypothetical protein
MKALCWTLAAVVALIGLSRTQSPEKPAQPAEKKDAIGRSNDLE